MPERIRRRSRRPSSRLPTSGVSLDLLASSCVTTCLAAAFWSEYRHSGGRQPLRRHAGREGDRAGAAEALVDVSRRKVQVRQNPRVAKTTIPVAFCLPVPYTHACKLSTIQHLSIVAAAPPRRSPVSLVQCACGCDPWFVSWRAACRLLRAACAALQRAQGRQRRGVGVCGCNRLHHPAAVTRVIAFPL